MEEFITSYGAWIVLAGVFVAMRWFGLGCGAGHRHAGEPREGSGEPMDPKKEHGAHSGRAPGGQ